MYGPKHALSLCVWWCPSFSLFPVVHPSIFFFCHFRWCLFFVSTGHVHLYGDISMDSTMGSTGGHYVGKPIAPRTEIANFASPGTAITADAQGKSTLTFTDAEIKLHGENSILGRSIIIHGDSPTNTGVRVAMCVIGLAEESSTATVPAPVTVLEADKRTLTARVSGKRVASTVGPVVKYEGYTGATLFQGRARVTETPAGLVASVAMLGTVTAATRVPNATVAVVETIDAATGRRQVQLRYSMAWGPTAAQPVNAGIHIHRCGCWWWLVVVVVGGG